MDLGGESSPGAVPRVLVTRPAPGAGITARRLEAAGFGAVVLPLTETRPLPASLAPGLGFDAVAATSAQALRFAAPQLLRQLRDKPFFAVGARTAAAARTAGFAEVLDAAGDALSLARLVLSRPSVQNLLYLCGRVRRADFETALQAGGVSVLPLECYDMVALLPSPRLVVEAFGGVSVQAVLLYSAHAAEAFNHLRENPVAGPLMRHAAVFALSPRILDAVGAGHAGFAALQPNEDALFALLERWQAGTAPFQPSRVC